MHSASPIFVKLLLCLAAFLAVASASPAVDVSSCSVVILGGTTASLAAAISSASSGVSTCLLEPTDWPGGQITASGVPAIDFAWHTLTNPSTGFVFPVYKYARQSENLSPLFYSLVQKVGNPGKCWVSLNCFDPHGFLNLVRPLLGNLAPQLKVYYNTVVKRIQRTTVAGEAQATIVGVTAIQRTPVSGTGYDRLLSEDLADMYSVDDSTRFRKTVLQFRAPAGGRPWIVMDATEWGEGLALADAPYLQGAGESFDGDVSGKGGNETCGQSLTYGIAERLFDAPQVEPPNPHPYDFGNYYSFSGWDRIFTYRRLLGKSAAPSAGDITLQNWGKGNDNAFAYLFPTKAETRAQVLRDAWMGGVSREALMLGEYLALGWHYYFKNHSVGDTLVLDRGTIFETAHGLTKMPYIRDTRRSIGVGDFVLKVSDMSGWPDPNGNLTGFAFPDRIALGCYDVDTHPSPTGCQYPPHIFQYFPILPFFVPLRALTNKALGNFLVAGKTMAQSFLANSATRLHPTEWSTGTAAGVAAAYMVQRGVSATADLCANHVKPLQAAVEKLTPIRWSIEGKLYPSA